MNKRAMRAFKDFEETLEHSIYIKSKSYNYQNNTTLITLNCEEHGDFVVLPKNFRRSKGRAGCEGCSLGEKAKVDFEEKLEVSIYEKSVDYKYIQTEIKVWLKCPDHGNFLISPEKFRIGQRCFDCSRTSPEKSLNDLILLMKEEKYLKADSFKYMGVNENVDMICPEKHFWSVAPGSFKNGIRCGHCSGYSKEESEIKFINEVYSRGFSLSDDYFYIKNSIEVEIECPIHGSIKIIPNNFKSGNGCKKCSGKCSDQAQEKFERTVTERGFSFSETYKYITGNDKVWLECPQHKEFQTVPKDFFGAKYGCPMCSGVAPEQAKNNFEMNVSTRKFKFADDYQYINTTTHVHLICPHGHSCPSIVPDGFNQGRGCRVCAGNDSETSKKDFLNLLLREKYFMTNTVPYINTDEKVELICPKKHKWQVPPASFKSGVRCFFCNLISSESSGEKITRDFLLEFDISFIEQFRSKWLGRQSIDFYLNNYNVGLEINGGHHFNHGKTIKRDKDKYQKMQINKVKLITVDAYHGISGRIDTIEKNKQLFLKRLRRALLNNGIKIN